MIQDIDTGLAYVLRILTSPKKADQKKGNVQMENVNQLLTHKQKNIFWFFQRICQSAT
jgi:hypothetical protein